MRAIERLNPIALTIYFLLVSGRVMFSNDPVLLCCSLMGALALHFALHGLTGWKTHGYTIALFAVMALMNPIFNHNGATVLFVMNDNPVTLEACLYGLSAAGMIVAVLYWFRAFSFVMTSDKLLYVFGGISPRLALLLSMTLRYVPLFGAQARKVSQAQKALGLYKEDNIVDSFKAGLRVFSVMVTWTLENGIITADSMTARGYGTGRRSRYSLFRWRTEDALFLILSLVLCTLSAIFDRAVVYYPLLQIAPLTVRATIGYVAYGMLACMPVFICGKEAVKWHVLMYRM
ncbi:MAG: energy-coupling factor transporter transmembrane protein EcfT [Clostridia bacterium]|nr:energy-coupling factor transporter transmembrane protein EcfT [Clostridia bacterium]